MRRLLVSLTTAGSLIAGPGVVPAAVPAPDPVLSQANDLANAGRYLEAARLLRDELGRVPEVAANRGRRNQLATQAINAYGLAFAGAPTVCDTATDGLTVGREYLAGFEAAYGVGARRSDEYTGVDELRAELDRNRAASGCPGLPPPPPPPPPKIQPASTSTPTHTDLPASPREQPGRKSLVIGLGVTAGFAAAALAISLGTGLSRAKGPIQGLAYKNVYDAAVDSYKDDMLGNEVNYAEGAEMCTGDTAARNPGVAEACQRYDRLRDVALATGVLAGAALVGTAVFAGLLVRQQRRHGVKRAGMSHFALGAAPRQEGGWIVAGSLRF